MSSTASVNSAMAPLALARRCDDRFSEQTPPIQGATAASSRTRKSDWQSPQLHRWQQQHQRVEPHIAAIMDTNSASILCRPKLGDTEDAALRGKAHEAVGRSFGQVIRPLTPAPPSEEHPLFLERPMNARSIGLVNEPHPLFPSFLQG